MQSLGKVFFLLSLAFPCIAVAQGENIYPPRVIRDYSILPEYPAQLVEFTRAPAIFYSMDYSNYSIDYDYGSAIHDTIYIYDAAAHPNSGMQLATQLMTEVASAHPDTVLVGQDVIPVINNHTRYWAQRVVYASGKKHELYTEVIFIEDEYKYVLLKSTATAAYKDTASAKNVQLLSSIKWPVVYDYQKNRNDLNNLSSQNSYQNQKSYQDQNNYQEQKSNDQRRISAQQYYNNYVQSRSD